DLRIPEEMVLVDKNFHDIQITLEGPREIIRDTTEDAIKLTYDLSYIDRSGSVTFELKQSDFQIPTRTRIINVIPQQVTIIVDRTVLKTLQVKPDVVDKPMTGFAVKDTGVSPSYVSVIGPESVMKDLIMIKTLPVSLMGRNRSFVQTVSLEPLVSDQDQRALQQVEVSVKIDRLLEKKSFSNIPIHILSAGKQTFASVLITPQSAEVTLETMPSVLENIDSELIKAYVDVSGLGPGTYELPINIVPIAGIENYSVNPSELVVEVRPKLEI
ncbi:MAG: CdaR family protein, partial [Chlamydiota bacterium]|nr:CdaR family protein [Chlamydiota bacterium]